MGAPTVIGTESRFFTGLFDDRKKIKASTAMLAFFTRGKTAISMNAEDFDDSVIRGNKKIAALVPRAGSITRQLGPTIKTQKPGPFSKFSRRFPLALEYFAVESNLLNKAAPPEMTYKPWSREERLRYYVSEGLEEAMRRTADLDNALAGQSMRLGKQDAILGTSNTDEQYNWQRDAASMSNAAYAGFKQNTRIKSEADNRRFEAVQVEGGFVQPPDHKYLTDNGWILRGKLITDEGYELYIYTTQDYYEDANGDVVDIMPSAQAFVTSSGAQFDRFFGPPKTLELTTAKIQWWIERFGIDPRVPIINDRVPSGILPRDSFFLWGNEAETGDSVDLWVQHAPIFKTTQTDAVSTLLGLV
jgi:hypothetical protein